MKSLLVATTLFTTILGPTTQAQEKTQFTHNGNTCIFGYFYSAPEVLETVSIDTTEFIKKNCNESEKNLRDTLEIDLKHTGRCPYGHSFEYTLKIKCTPK